MIRRLEWSRPSERRSRAYAGAAFALACAVLAPRAAVGQGPESVRPVAAFDLGRYLGRWYEVARLPNRFQARCVAETTADYELLDDGSLRVVNTCLAADGERMRAEGRARRATRADTSARLKVRFAPAVLSFLPMVWADYWVLALTEDYGAALVGTPDRKYLWLLSREPALGEATYQGLVAVAAAQGFDVSRLVRPGAT